MLLSARNAERNINFLIEHQCPQCGAPATLEETDRLFTCDFCKVKSFLHCRKYFRYILPSKAPADKELIYFPYWRFRGMILACVVSGIKNKIIDFSQQAVASSYFPFSVGFRSQALKLRFAEPDTAGYFIKPELPFDGVRNLVGDRFKTTRSDPLIHQTFVGETISLIYSPLYVDKKVYDAVLNEPLKTRPPEDMDMTALPGGVPDWQIEFIAAQCPHCGWDLSGNRDSLMMNCKNCHSIWRPSKDKFRRIKYAYLPGGQETAIYFPFWRIKADIDGINLKTYEDMLRVSNLPKVATADRKDNPFYFWSPAFKIRPQMFLNLSRSITFAQPEDKLLNELPDAPVGPVTLSVGEAVESLKISLAGFMKPRQTIADRLPNITIKPTDLRLVYVPFNEGPHEYIHPQYKIALHKSMIKTAKHL